MKGSMSVQGRAVFSVLGSVLALTALSASCHKNGGSQDSIVASDAATKVYVAPGQHDEFYAFISGGFSGQISVYGLPSGRLLKVLPVFSVNPENGYGFNEETKPMLQTSHGFSPWDDQHHTELSQTDGVPDGRWVFGNANNTPRIARVSLDTFKTAEIIEIPNSSGNHGSPFSTMNTEYLVASTRFSVPVPQKDVPISSAKENFKGTLSFVKIEKDTGAMSLGFQLLVPGIDYDLGHCGKGDSRDWCYFTSYNSEQSYTRLERNASKNDKDFIAAVNWRTAEKCVADGKGTRLPAKFVHNKFDEATMTAHSETLSEVKVIAPKDCPEAIYFIPIAKSPHGVDVDPSGQFVVGSGKLAAQITVFDSKKIIKAAQEKKFAGDFEGIPILDYPSVLAGEVQKPCLGPLHTEFDGRGFGYTSCFVSSEVVKWKLGSWEVVDRIPTYYSLGHLMIPGGDSAKPWGKYLVAMNKITKDRYLPTGPELPQAAQLIDISGDKMKLLLDFPTVGEPHYAQGIPASVVKDKVKKIYPIEDNKHAHVIRKETDTRVERQGKDVHVYMTAIRSHLTPDNIEGVKIGDTVYFHVTNLEQDWDVPHGFTIHGSESAELLIMPGETQTLKYEARLPGVFPFYCTDFCSALHQEMQGYLRVSPASSDTSLKYGTGN